ncbi:hypothetical protein BRL79_00215, partial [Xanthomonas oryzae pv. oryzae]
MQQRPCGRGALVYRPTRGALPRSTAAGEDTHGTAAHRRSGQRRGIAAARPADVRPGGCGPA